MTTFKEFCEAYGIYAVVTHVPQRTDGMMGGEYSQTATHYVFTLMRDQARADDTLRSSPITIHTGQYSKGFGHAEQWAKKNRNNMRFTARTRQYLKNPLEPGKRWLPESEYVQEIRRVAGPKVMPTPAELIESLAMDAQGSDEHFKDWAAGLGYSDDSIKARDIWEECNEIRRNLQKALGADAYEQLQDIEE